MQRFFLSWCSALLLAACTLPQTEAPKADAPDQRPVLTWEKLQSLNEEKTEMLCDMETYAAPATETAPYRSEGSGIAMNLPYNPRWGTREHRLPPFYELPEEHAILFGPLEHGEGCSLLRHWEVKILPPRSAAAASAAVRASMIEGSAMTEPPPEITPTIVRIGPLIAVEYVDVGLCSYPTIEVIGNKGNYKIAYCASGKDREADLEPVRKIVRTMKIL